MYFYFIFIDINHFGKSKQTNIHTSKMELRTIIIVMLFGTFFIEQIISAPVEKTNTELEASIQEIQKKFSGNSNKKNDDELKLNRRIDHNDVTENTEDTERISKHYTYPSDSKTEASYRKDKMLGYFGYFPQVPQLGPLPTQAYFSPEYYGDYSQGEEEDIMSRSNRRRPQNNINSINPYDNSPIFYIRLPPTPYMFVPGYGYISNPPSITPMNALGQMSHVPQMSPLGTSLGSPMQQMPQMQQMNPFINLPINFLANGKPTNVYQWNTGAGYQQPNPYQMGYQQRPQQRPQFKPKPNYLQQDSKITHLKGQYLFNGRPEEIYLLPQSYNSLYSEPIHQYY